MWKCILIFALLVLSLIAPSTAFTASIEKTYDQALQLANLQLKNNGFDPEQMIMNYGTEDGTNNEIVKRLTQDDGFVYHDFFVKKWHSFHYCLEESKTCMWVLVSKTDDDVIFW